ncbi:nucleolar protein 12 [Manduca sexta]|uniref:Nucleolar protein 12 n=1 Tax=Manduca sexta TaxID=7130 RepID=A0A922CM48_MANSE|nr:nucleolar protein 12 [Manduca sexta]KAG6452105.1 hypothetical protein O3G_MSEX007468 [Manduca sexta]
MGKRNNKNQERKKKVNLVFDESKRKEFLCGFRKRKLERKKKAQEELQRLLKEEKKRIKQENKESYKKLIVSSRPIPDIEQLLQEEYEDEDVNVKIVELSSDTLQKKDLVIGENRPKEPIAKKDVKKKSEKNVQTVPGMDSEEESEEEVEEEQEDDKLKTKKDIKRMLKKQATKKVQKSKVFQMKNKLERVKNKKKSQQKSRHMGKVEQKKDKSKKKNNFKRKHK